MGFFSKTRKCLVGTAIVATPVVFAFAGGIFIDQIFCQPNFQHENTFSTSAHSSDGSDTECASSASLALLVAGYVIEAGIAIGYKIANREKISSVDVEHQQHREEQQRLQSELIDYGSATNDMTPAETSRSWFGGKGLYQRAKETVKQCFDTEENNRLIIS